MKKYVVSADSVTYKGKVLKKGKKIKLDDKEAKKLIEIKAIKPFEVEKKAEAKTEEKKK